LFVVLTLALFDKHWKLCNMLSYPPQAFQELQGKMIMTQQQLKISDAQIETLKRTVTRNRLVEAELGRLPENTRVYEGVGRM